MIGRISNSRLGTKLAEMRPESGGFLRGGEHSSHARHSVDFKYYNSVMSNVCANGIRRKPNQL